MLCKNCDGNVKSDYKYCPYCGERIVNDFHDQFETFPPPFVRDAAFGEDDGTATAAADFSPDLEPEPVRFARPPLFDEDEPDAPEEGGTPYFVYRPDDADGFLGKESAPPIQRPAFERETHENSARARVENERSGVGAGFKSFLIVLILLVAATITVFGYQIFVAQRPFGISEFASVNDEDASDGQNPQNESAAASAPPEINTSVDLQELQARAGEWETLSSENGYVMVAGNEDLHDLSRLEEWISAYQSGKPAEVVLLLSGATVPIAYQLTCDSSKMYTVRWFGSTGGSYSADKIYKRAFDYVFGESEVQHFKGPLTVPTMAVNEIFAGSKPADWEFAMTEDKAQQLAKDASAGVGRYVEMKGGVNGLGIRIDADIAEAAPEPVQTRVSAYLRLYDKPCYLVDLFQSKENMEKDEFYDRISVSGDGKWMLLSDLADGGWIPVCDLEEQVITVS